MKFFITGAAGFVGFHLAKRLLDDGHEVLGYDGMTEYYDPSLKRDRVAVLAESDKFTFVEAMLEDAITLESTVATFRPEIIVHLAAQAGVRYSIEAPATYVDSNLVGTFNVLEVARNYKPRHLLFASTSSVYGGNTKLPFSESDSSHFPISLYAATKKAGEAMSHSYSHLFGIPTTCFRFFTVYGPWGRPDMALFKFVDRINRGEEIEIYGEGKMSRDFTYIDDLITAITLLVDAIPEVGKPVDVEGGEDSLSPVAPWRVVNIAGGNPVGLLEFVESLEKHLGVEAQKKLLPLQLGDPRRTNADPALLSALTAYQATTPVDEGIKAFVDWHRSYYVAV